MAWENGCQASGSWICTLDKAGCWGAGVRAHTCPELGA